MTAISFSGCVQRGKFYELILKGEKNQTIREPRKIPIRVGGDLTLYWKQRVPTNLKPIHFIGKTICTENKEVIYSDIYGDLENAIADGFKDLKEFRFYFGGYDMDQKFDIIKWEPLKAKIICFEKYYPQHLCYTMQCPHTEACKKARTG